MNQPNYRRPDKVLIYLYRFVRALAGSPASVQMANSQGVSVLYLLLQRHPEKTRSGSIWQTVVGSVRWGEELGQAARREVYEETGLTMLGGITAIGYTFSFPIRVPENQESWYAPGETTISNSVFAAEVIGQQAVHVGPEHMAYGWFSVEGALEKLRWKEEKEALLHLHPLIQTRLLAIAAAPQQGRG